MRFIDIDKHKDCTGIYRIVHLNSGKSYIGKTLESFQRRYWHHAWCLQNNCHVNIYLQNAWNKYGSDAFAFEVLEYANDELYLNQLEMHYIRIYRAVGLSYNISSGGDGKTGCPMSEHAKKIVGEKNRLHMIGKRASDETRAKMRASSKHVSPSKEHRERLREYMSHRVVSDETRQKIANAFMGSKSSFAKLDEDRVASIKRKLNCGIGVNELMEEYAVSYSTIVSIRDGKTWKHVH